VTGAVVRAGVHTLHDETVDGLEITVAAGVVVEEEYSDAASGIMEERPGGSGAFVEVTLRPAVKISADSDAERALALHEEAHRKCFIANSVSFPVRHEPRVGH
jgi:organic hydroperoxide reductase OsmC/OhrA